MATGSTTAPDSTTAPAPALDAPADRKAHGTSWREGARSGVAIHQWLLKHPRFHLHFTPASSSWMNLERWYCQRVTGPGC